MIQAMPKGIEVDETGYTLKIIRKWFGFTTIFLLIFAAFWMGFLAFFYSMMLGDMGIMSSNAGMGDDAIFFLLFPMIHVAVGVGISYRAICGLINKTVITVESGVLKIKHGPLPWPGSKEISVNDLRQLYAKETRSHSSKGGTSYHYSLMAVTAENKSIALVKGLANGDQAKYMEDTIEKYLGIEDEAVSGEMPKQRDGGW